MNKIILPHFDVFLLIIFFLIIATCHISPFIITYIYAVRGEKIFRRIIRKFILRCVLILLFFSVIESLLYASQFFTFLIGLLFVAGADIMIFANMVTTLFIHKTLIDALSTRKNFYFSIGMFYVAIKIRDIYLFAFPHIRKKLVVLFDDQFKQCRPPLSRILGRYVKVKKREQKKINGIHTEIIEGSIKFLDPTKNVWLQFTGKFLILEI